ncbi:MaoC/PaaZ C-terminal domain-containing protein [Amycolatopsis sp. PS_44_ISF1]|uniref:MaoC/PaaZ C-terminal domain-containing protein n=1 Tax=Amycolatopsis sp. PS_44_ISF1 TaxID=2974917 RepID=UPI0028DFE7AA|nr:MaoC/PaaZ C-terminal domain-containing protein [Amycolatopsis sp. PS_44_ISF1]MDT8910547.1 MaoC/PaaZ C-terminal domain-containing protein [Amycolatopsis sp. PS_44_ISF1]
MAVRELNSAPSLATLYPKALLRRGGGSKLPDLELVRSGVVVDPAHVAAYAEVCGFRFGDELPATYPHLLAFPVQMALMTEPGFPFPLLGMVHVANRITQRRPLRLGETFTVRVRAEDLRPHEKGRQFDVVSEVSVGAETVWTDVSTYLHRGGGSGASGPRAQLASPTPNAIWKIPGDIGRRYAEVSGDRNPIHLHPLSARLFGFPSAIAHGMWTKAHALASFEGRLPPAFTVDVRFKQPVLLPAKAAFTTWATEDGWAFELWNARKPKPHLDGTISAL